MTKSPYITAVDAAREILEAQDAGRPVALIVTLESDLVPMGRRVLVDLDGSRGALGGPSWLDDQARRLGSAALRGVMDPHRQRPADEATPGKNRPPDPPGEGVHTLGPGGQDKDGVPVYLELHLPRAELIIVGAGHIARPLCTIGALLDFRVFVLDDRPRFATRERFPEAEEVRRVDFSDPFHNHAIGPWSHLVLVTRGHRYDYECLRRLLHLEPPPGYIGMIGSRRRVRATYVQLQEEGIPLSRIRTVRAPVGLDLGAETPEEIAVSVASELILHRRGGTGHPLADQERIVDRFFKE